MEYDIEVSRKEINISEKSKLIVILKRNICRQFKIECFLNDTLLKPSERISGRKLADVKWKNFIEELG